MASLARDGMRDTNLQNHSLEQDQHRGKVIQSARTNLLIAQRLHDMVTFLLIQHHTSILAVHTVVLRTQSTHSQAAQMDGT